MKQSRGASERAKLIAELRTLILGFDGSVEDSPYYSQLARLLVSDCIIGKQHDST